MTFIEKFQKTTDMKHWPGDMEVDHFFYTAGVAGEIFFTALRDKGAILGARCESCGVVYVPPRIYCEDCFGELRENAYIDVGLRGQVRSFTVARLGKDGQELKKPEIFAIIGLGPKSTGFLHKLGEITPAAVRVGLEVKAVLKPKAEREGHITDIAYFRPAAKGNR